MAQMDCENFFRYMDLYLDDELAEEERASLEVHLASCEECRRRLSAEVEFRSELRKALSKVRAPEDLRTRVQRRLEEAREQKVSWHVPLLSVVAVILLAVVGYGVLSMEKATGDKTEEVISLHKEATSREVYGTIEEVVSFLKDHAPFTFKLPFKEGPGVRLIGARLHHIGSIPAIIYLYEIAGRRVSVAQYPGDGHEVRLVRHSDLTVATFASEGLIQTLVGDIPEHEVRRFIPASASSP